MRDMTNIINTLNNTQMKTTKLTEMIKNYPLIVERNTDAICNQIRPRILWLTEANDNPYKTTPHNIFELTDTVFQRNIIGDAEYEILRTIAFVVEKSLKNIGDDSLSHHKFNTRDDEKALLLSMMSHNTLCEFGTFKFGGSEMNVISTFYRWIVDLYIPSSNPEELVKVFLKYFMLKDIVRLDGYTNYITDAYKTFLVNKTSVPLKEIVLLFKIINDIYSNPLSSKEFVRGVHYMKNHIYKIRDDINLIFERFEDYFQSAIDCSDFILRLLHVLLGQPSPSSYNGIEDFIKENYHECKDRIPKQVLLYMVTSVIGIIQQNDEYLTIRNNANINARNLIEKWGNPEYDIIPLKTVSESYTDYDDGEGIITALENYTKMAMESKVSATRMSEGEKKIYKAYKAYKNAEDKVSTKINQAGNAMKKAVIGDIQSEVIEGRKFTPITLLKQLLGTVALFSFGPIKAIIALVVRRAIRKKTTESERRKIIMEIETEITMLDEKIQDAKSDNNREAKYCMMRTRKELENARKRIMYGMEADTKTLKDTKAALKVTRTAKGGNRYGEYR